MKIVVLVVLAAFTSLAAAQSCNCTTMKWAKCDSPGGSSQCTCTVTVDVSTSLTLNCAALIPKCFLMKAEMYRARNNLGTRSIGGKPIETAFVDNDGIYDPVCENDGKFKARQSNGTEEYWCVNSAGVRRTDKGDSTLKCDELVETYWIRLQLTHKAVNAKLDEATLKTAIGDAIQKRYTFDKNLVKEIKYDPDARLIVVDVKKPETDTTTNLANMAYYMEKDVKVLPLFMNQETFSPQVGGQKLEMEKILVYYVDAKPPTFTMRYLSGGIIAVIVVVVLAVVIGLLALFFYGRHRRQKYSKTQQREMEPMSRN